MTAFSIRPPTGVIVGSESFSSFFPLVTPLAKFFRTNKSMSILINYENKIIFLFKLMNRHDILSSLGLVFSFRDDTIYRTILVCVS